MHIFPVFLFGLEKLEAKNLQLGFGTSLSVRPSSSQFYAVADRGKAKNLLLLGLVSLPDIGTHGLRVSLRSGCVNETNCAGNAWVWQQRGVFSASARLGVVLQPVIRISSLVTVTGENSRGCWVGDDSVRPD